MYIQKAEEIRLRLAELREIRKANNDEFPTDKLKDEFMDKYVLLNAIVLKRDFNGDKYAYFERLLKGISKGNPIVMLTEGPKIMMLVEDAVKRMEEEDALEEANQIING